MSLESFTGNIGNAVGNGFDSLLDSAGAILGGIADSAGTFVTNIWGGGFVGVSNYDELKAAINTYTANVQAAVEEYNQNADISSAVKGEAEVALVEFVQATKELLKAFAQMVTTWNGELDSVYQAYTQGSSSIASNVSSDAQAVRQAASNVSLD